MGNAVGGGSGGEGGVLNVNKKRQKKKITSPIPEQIKGFHSAFVARPAPFFVVLFLPFRHPPARPPPPQSEEVWVRVDELKRGRPAFGASSSAVERWQATERKEKTTVDHTGSPARTKGESDCPYGRLTERPGSQKGEVTTPSPPPAPPGVEGSFEFPAPEKTRRAAPPP